MKDHCLYFFAIPLPFELKEEIQLITESISSRYQTTKALNSEPHITVIPPFWYPKLKQDTLKNVISYVSKFTWEFEIELDGYGTFPRNVLFVNVKLDEQLQEVYDRTYQCLPEDLSIKVKKYEEFHPHITVAFKDISDDAFAQAKSEFSDRSFSGIFEFETLALYRHNGKTWNRI